MLKKIDFSVDKGEFIAIMGPSGSGKSTLLNIIAMLITPTNGKLYVNEQDTLSLKESERIYFRRQELGIVFQDNNLIDTLTVGQNILLPLTIERYKKKEMMDRLRTTADYLMIEKILEKRTHQISGGQAQLACIARAIINNPTLLLADEPTGNLDSASVKKVMRLFSKIHDEKNMTTLIVTHDPYVASFAQRVIFINDGQLYNELHTSGNQRSFYERILDVITFLGGGQNELF